MGNSWGWPGWAWPGIGRSETRLVAIFEIRGVRLRCNRSGIETGLLQVSPPFGGRFLA